MAEWAGAAGGASACPGEKGESAKSALCDEVTTREEWESEIGSCF